MSIELVESGQEEIIAMLRRRHLALALTYDLEIADDLDFESLAELPPLALFAADPLPSATRSRSPSLRSDR